MKIIHYLYYIKMLLDASYYLVIYGVCGLEIL